MHPGSPSDPSGTAAAKATLKYVYSILKPHGQRFRRQVRLLLSKAKPSYVYSILKPHGFQEPCQTAATGGKAELRIYNLKKTSPPQSWSQAVVCVSTPRMYLRSRIPSLPYSDKILYVFLLIRTFIWYLLPYK